MKMIKKVIIIYDDGTCDEIQSQTFTPNTDKQFIPKPPFHPLEHAEKKLSCEVCGMVWDGPMGYVCQRFDCPSNVRFVSSPDISSSCFS